MVFATIATLFVSRYLPKVRHSVKLVSSTVIRTLAFLGFYLAFEVESKEFGFWLSMASSAALGAFTSIDHTVFLGFLKSLPPYCYSGYSSGVGFSSLLTICLYLLMKSLSIGVKYVSLALIPLNMLIVVCFYYMVHIKTTIKNTSENCDSPKNYENEDLIVVVVE